VVPPSVQNDASFSILVDPASGHTKPVFLGTLVEQLDLADCGVEVDADLLSGLSTDKIRLDEERGFESSHGLS